MKILILTDWLAPYRIDLFNKMSEYADVSVFYMDTASLERNDAWKSSFCDKCNYHKMSGKKLFKLGTLPSEFIKEFNTKNYDIVAFDGYGSFSQIYGICRVSKKTKRFFINIDGAIVRDSESKLAYMLKKIIMNRGGYFLCGSKVSNSYLAHYGVSQDRIFNHPFTSLFESDINTKIKSDDEKKELRKKLGMKEKQIVLSVGRFTYKEGYGKGYDAVLRAASRMPKDIGFYIVGDEPTEEFLKMKEELKADNVHFVGFKKKDELKLYYEASDLFVLMTVYDVWGLVINEAMACGLPVITTDMCVAGLELVSDGENGFIVPVGDDTLLELRINDVLSDDKSRERMANNSLKTIGEYTIENVAKQHIRVFKKILENDRF